MPAVNKRSESWILWIILFQLLFIFGPTVAWLIDRWTMSVWHNAHGLLIVLLVAYYIRLKLLQLDDLSPSSSAAGFYFLIPGLVIFILDTGMHTQLLGAFALYFVLPGMFLLLFGAKRTKAIGFYLFMLFLSLPIPLVLTESIHLFLRNIATVSAAWIVPKLGIPVYFEGTTLYIPSGALQVADACSGFSTLYAAVAVACVTAYFCSDARRRFLVVIAAAPVAIAANIFRVVLLVLLVQTFGLRILDTSLHTISGLFTFALTIPIIFWLGKGFSPAEAER